MAGASQRDIFTPSLDGGCLTRTAQEADSQAEARTYCLLALPSRLF